MAVDDQYTVSLMHFDGNLTDESGKTWTAYGGATTSAAAAKFGSGGLYCPSTSSSYLSVPKTGMTLSGDFTVEFLVYPTSADGQTYFGDGDNIAWSAGSFDIMADDYIRFRAASGNAELFEIKSTATLASLLNTWVHVAYVRSGSTYYGFINGVLAGSVTNATSLNAGQSSWFLGGALNGRFCAKDAYFDELRISNVARYVSNFTPPTSPFGPASSTTRRRCVI